MLLVINDSESKMLALKIPYSLRDAKILPSTFCHKNVDPIPNIEKTMSKSSTLIKKPEVWFPQTTPVPPSSFFGNTKPSNDNTMSSTFSTPDCPPKIFSIYSNLSYTLLRSTSLVTVEVFVSSTISFFNNVISTPLIIFLLFLINDIF